MVSFLFHFTLFCFILFWPLIHLAPCARVTGIHHHTWEFLNLPLPALPGVVACTYSPSHFRNSLSTEFEISLCSIARLCLTHTHRHACTRTLTRTRTQGKENLWDTSTEECLPIMHKAWFQSSGSKNPEIMKQPVPRACL